MPNKLTQAILDTLAYSHHFHFPLTFSELHTRLIRTRLSPARLKLALAPLIQTGVVATRRSYYFLPGQDHLVPQRLLYARLSRPLRAYAVSLLPTLTQLPTVRALYLTGSLAMHNTDGHDDIDLLVITAPGTLWTTRLILTLFTTLLGLRRSRRNPRVMGKLCLNLYLTPTSYALPPTRRSLYTAYELIQATPLYDPHNTRAALLSANAWLQTYLPNFPFPSAPPAPLPPRPGLLVRLLETALFNLQYLYMKPKITREYITPDAAFFHPSDPSRKILRKIHL